MMPRCEDSGKKALELARQAGCAHLLMPGTPSTRRPRPRDVEGLGLATDHRIYGWQHHVYRDREILWLTRTGPCRDGQLAVVDTDLPLAGVLAAELLPHTDWTVSTKSPGAFHRYYLLADSIEDYERSTLDPITLKAGINSYVVAAGSPGYVPEPGFGSGTPPLLHAGQWNTYIRHMTALLKPPAPAQRLSDHPPTHNDQLCPNTSLGWPREDHLYQCRGDSASSWRNFLRAVCARFVYRRWRHEGRETPSLSRTMAFMTKAHDNNRCHEHEYHKLNDLIERTWSQSCQRASDEGYAESQARKGRLRAQQRWEPFKVTITARNRSIIADHAAGLTVAAIAATHQVCRQTVYRTIPPLLRQSRPKIAPGGDRRLM